MLVVFPIAQRELDRALELLAWMKQLGPYESHRILIVTSSKVSMDDTKSLAEIAGEVFPRVDAIHQRDENEEPWPRNANAMFRTAVNYVTQKYAGDPFLWVETDMIPLFPGWLDAIEREYRRCGKLFMGAYYGNPFPHINGGMVYPAHLNRINPAMVNAVDRPFDLTRPDIQLHRGHKTNLIVRSLADPKTNTAHTFPDFESLSIIPAGCLIFHGCKDGTLIARLKERGLTSEYVTQQYVTQEFVSVPYVPVSEPVTTPRLAIAGLIKGDCPQLTGLLNSMLPLLEKLPTCRGFFCVNTLTCSAVVTLQKWAKAHDFPVEIFVEPRVLPTGRYSKMAVLRNAYLNRIEASGFKPEFLLALDMDIAGFASWEGMGMLIADSTWTAAAVLGLRPKTELPHFHESTEVEFKGKVYCYYDLLAFESIDKERVLWAEGKPPMKWFWHGAVPAETKFSNLFPFAISAYPKPDAAEVNSAFGPAAFYRWDKIKAIRYNEWSGECEHQIYNRAIRQQGGTVVIANKIVALYSDPYKHIPNSGVLSKIGEAVKRVLTPV